ncbi:hypothetical protein CDD83_8863 [Cordyceps sp. RAO-2017]|nr:hypothetical protein CDD83_8863 [Cordyceps sp. RAO-2017]
MESPVSSDGKTKMVGGSPDLAKTSSQPAHQRLHQQSTTPSEENVLSGSAIAGEVSEFEERRADVEKQKAAEGDAHFHRLGWKRLTVILIVEAVALGSLSLPAAFATLGMVAGVFCTVGLGLIAIFTSDIVGQVKLKYPEVAHYADAGRLLMGRFGYELVGAMFVLQLTFLVGSHTLTGTIAFLNMTDNGACSVIFGFVSAVILLALAVPPSFAEVAILGYIDFVSIIAAIGLTIIATGIQASQREGGMASVDWSAWPKPGITFADAFIAIANIVFAYSFCMCQFTFMDEMHTPSDYIKSIWSLGIIEIAIYTITGALVYAFVGVDVRSPALLSAGTLISKIAFGIALPVIFISGSINTTVIGRYLHGRMFRNSVTRFINTPKGWATWLALITVITIIAFVIAEVIPFFSDLLSISSSLFVSGFTFYLPAMMWFQLLCKGKWYARENIVKSLMSAFCFVIGIVVLVCGTYASIDDIAHQFNNGSVRGVFTCKPIA